MAALLDRGGDPTLLDDFGDFPLMNCATRGDVDLVARLLQDPCVRATIESEVLMAAQLFI